jgi:hypothetical protein
MSPTGPAVRVNLTVGFSPGDPAGPRLEHTFFCRLNAAGYLPAGAVQVVSAFLDPDDAPGDQLLP